MRHLLLTAFILISLAGFSQSEIYTITDLYNRINTEIIPNGQKAITGQQMNKILNGFINVMPSYSNGLTNNGVYPFKITLGGNLTTHTTLEGQNFYDFSFNNIHTFKITSPQIQFNLGGDQTGDMYYRSVSGYVGRLAPPVGISKPMLTFKNGLPAWDTASAGGSSGGSVDLSNYPTREELTDSISANKVDLSSYVQSPDVRSFTAADTARWGQNGTGGIAYTFSSEFTNAANNISVNSIAASKITGLATVATTGSYTDLLNKPTIPSYSNGYGLLLNSNTFSIDTSLLSTKLYTRYRSDSAVASFKESDPWRVTDATITGTTTKTMTLTRADGSTVAATFNDLSNGGNGSVAGITLNTPNVLFANPVNFTGTNGSWVGNLTMNNQSAYYVLGNHTGSAANPTFGLLNVRSINATGSTYNGTKYLSDDGTWKAVSSGTTYTNGYGINLSGTTFSLDSTKTLLNQFNYAQNATAYISGRLRTSAIMIADSGVNVGGWVSNPSSVSNGRIGYNTTSNQFVGYRGGSFQNFMMQSDSSSFIRNQITERQTANLWVSGRAIIGSSSDNGQSYGLQVGGNVLLTSSAPTISTNSSLLSITSTSGQVSVSGNAVGSGVVISKSVNEGQMLALQDFTGADNSNRFLFGYKKTANYSVDNFAGQTGHYFSVNFNTAVIANFGGGTYNTGKSAWIDFYSLGKDSTKPVRWTKITGTNDYPAVGNGVSVWKEFGTKTLLYPEGVGKLIIGDSISLGNYQLQVKGNSLLKGNLVLTPYTPSSSSDSTPLDNSIWFDINYIYIKQSGTIKRIALTTF